MTNLELSSSSKVYVGDTQAKKVYIGNTRVWSASRLPDGYEDIPYISSTKTGGQYIDLNYKLMETTDDIKLELKFNIKDNGLNTSGQGTFMSCKREISPYPGFAFRVPNQADVNDVRLEFGTKWQISNSYGGNGTWYVAGYETLNASSASNNPKKTNQIIEDTIILDNIPSTQTQDISTFVFCTFSSSNQPMRYVVADLYYLKITKGTQVVRDLLPAKRISDSAIGMYDVQNNVFYTSGSANSFVEGTDS